MEAVPVVNKQEEGGAKQEQAVQVKQLSWFTWLRRGFWQHVLVPLVAGIVFGIGSKLATVFVRYFIMGRWLGYREFMTPEQLKTYREQQRIPITK